MDRRAMLLNKARDMKADFCSPRDVRSTLALDYDVSHQEMDSIFKALGGTHMADTGEREILENTEQYNQVYAMNIIAEQWKEI